MNANSSLRVFAEAMTSSSESATQRPTSFGHSFLRRSKARLRSGASSVDGRAQALSAPVRRLIRSPALLVRRHGFGGGSEAVADDGDVAVAFAASQVGAERSGAGLGLLHHRAAVLLHDVGQLVGEELFASGASGVVLAATEEDVLAGGEGAGLQGVVEGVGFGVGVDTDAAEVGSEGGLHGGAHLFVQATAAGAGAFDRAFDVRSDRNSAGSTLALHGTGDGLFHHVVELVFGSPLDAS